MCTILVKFSLTHRYHYVKLKSSDNAYYYSTDEVCKSLFCELIAFEVMSMMSNTKFTHVESLQTVPKF